MFVDVLLTLHFIIWLTISVRVLTRYNLTAQARLAWIVVLFILPYIGVVVYWMFGEIHLGRHFSERHQKIMDELHRLNPEILGNADTLHRKIPLLRRTAFNYSAVLTGYHTTLGNRARLMQDASDTNLNMIKDFDNATEYIHVLYYIWLDDNTGQAVAEALIRAAKRGVTCRAMVDGLGSRRIVRSTLWRQMAEAGVEVSVALPIRNIFKVLLTSRIDLRNHRKITLIDGKVTYIGSRNCADPEFRVKAKYAPWVDIMLRVEGPVVAQSHMLFASDWLMENPDTPIDAFKFKARYSQDSNAIDHSSDYEAVVIDNQTTAKVIDEQAPCQLAQDETRFDVSYPNQPLLPQKEPDKQTPLSNTFAAQLFVDGPTQRDNGTPQFLNALIVSAQQSLIISTPYFVPNYTLINSLCAAAYRRIEVIMIFPKNNDSFIVGATSHSYYWQLLDSGVTIYEYIPGLLHAKTLTVDGEVGLIGSTNLDLRSFDLNYENNMLFYDKTLTAAIVERQKHYISQSQHITRSQVEHWSLPYRAFNNIIAMMGPIL